MPPHGEGSGHAHDPIDNEDGLGLSLRTHIDLAGVSCLNESIEGAGRSVLKYYEERMSTEPSLVSQEDDPELLFYIPFSEAVSIQHLSIRSLENHDEERRVSPPRCIKLFTNRDNIDFDTARNLQADMDLELLPPHHDIAGTLDYPLRPAGRFQNISSITILVVNNFTSPPAEEDDNEDEVSTLITYLGFKGRGSKAKRQAVNAIYETKGMPKDHKVKDDMTNLILPK
mmetsp:Transcript_3411/g.3978  ORF Transcript_3411/g.3978 Transcript_3411/m.3978 type:complete len:228 (-) Transcript_3411:205-888(-)|eukprot:CAMPEP_0194130116 /NCGR_PEP_ID=MMETSP0152-20130528/1245_1 /TAXON_ID=1049557 /ORGANISM="Thalassiothrix antarctica, Strain L6-D1" /LENGTH=227 /DNA_ID=CAMNT_0038824537 /DNA_START=85 /DNA_END=768 /DNA_ORIENTATION=+